MTAFIGATEIVRAIAANPPLTCGGDREPHSHAVALIRPLPLASSRRTRGTRADGHAHGAAAKEEACEHHGHEEGHDHGHGHAPHVPKEDAHMHDNHAHDEGHDHACAHDHGHEEHVAKKAK